MKIKIWGTRGSLPTPGPETTFYGGNTSCVSVRSNNNLVILDAGSGIRRLGFELKHYSRIDILLSHLHLDHIQGLGFFSPLYNPALEIHIWGASGASQSLRTRINRYLSPPLFPVRIRDLPCRLSIHELGREKFKIGDLTIHSDYVCHPSPTLGFRIEKDDKVFTYISDHEPALCSPGFPKEPKWTSGYSLAKSADLLIHDAQFSPEQYKNSIGWGHSSFEHTLKFAEYVKAKHLILFHHDPSHSDSLIRKFHKEFIQERGLPFKAEFAAEGKSYEL